jgi:hypothetical protein
MSDDRWFIRSLWVWRKSEEAPELAVAWDEWTIGENPQGFEDDCERALDRIGDVIFAHRIVRLAVAADAIEGAFDPPTVEAEVDA